MAAVTGTLRHTGGMSGPPTPSRSPLRALAIATFCIYFGYGLVTPILPLFARALGAGPALAGLIVAGFGLASFSLDLSGGRLSGVIGARRTAALGAGMVAFASLLAALAPNVWVLLLSRLVTGAGSAVYVTTALTLIARTTAPERMGRAMSVYQGAILLATAIGPAVGGALAGGAGFRLPFLIYAGIGLATAGIAVRRLPDLPRSRAAPGRDMREALPALPGPGASTTAPPFALVLRDGAFLTALGVAFVVFILRAGVNATAVPLYAHDVLGLGRGATGLALSVSAFSNFFFLPHAGWLADRRPRAAPIIAGLAAALITLALLGLWQSVAGLYAAMVVLGVATAYAGVAPAAVITDVTPTMHSATAMGAYRMAVDLGSVTGPLAAGVLFDWLGVARAFLLMAVPAALMLAAALRLRDTRACRGRSDRAADRR
jgi:DHA1 family multidrug resistance protein-like MFS transporter